MALHYDPGSHSCRTRMSMRMNSKTVKNLCQKFLGYHSEMYHITMTLESLFTVKHFDKLQAQFFDHSKIWLKNSLKKQRSEFGVNSVQNRDEIDIIRLTVS